jgi:hypothetical protein
MKPQHSNCDWEFEPLGIHMTAGFSLHAWGNRSFSEDDKGNEKESNQSCCTEVGNTPQLDCNSCMSNDHERSKPQLTTMRCSMELLSDASFEDFTIFQDDYIDTDLDQYCVDDFESDSEDSLSWLHAYEDAMEEGIYNERKRSVQFNETPVIHMFERHLPQDHHNLYYTAHELQHIIDVFVKLGGNSLFRSNLVLDDDDDDDKSKE